MNYKKLTLPLLLILILGVAVIYFFFSPYEYDMLPCPIYDYLHIHCGGCGTQRALHHWTHGEVLLALRNNLLFPVWVYLALDYLYSSIKERSPLMLRSWMPVFILTILVTFIILRNIPYYPFNLLAPVWE